MMMKSLTQRKLCFWPNQRAKIEMKNIRTKRRALRFGECVSMLFRCWVRKTEECPGDGGQQAALRSLLPTQGKAQLKQHMQFVSSFPKCEWCRPRDWGPRVHPPFYMTASGSDPAAWNRAQRLHQACPSAGDSLPPGPAVLLEKREQGRWQVEETEWGRPGWGWPLGREWITGVAVATGPRFSVFPGWLGEEAGEW